MFDVLLPFVVFSKSRQKTVSAVWEILETSEIAQHELLVGCADVLKYGNDGGDALATANLAIAARLAGMLSCLGWCLTSD